MIQIYLILFLLIIIYFAGRTFLKTSPALFAKYTKIIIFSIIGFLVLLLTATGRLNWLFALIGLAVAFLMRLIPMLLNYAPHIQRLWHSFSGSKQSSSQRQETNSNKGKMSVEEAYEVLGLKPGASKDSIIAAHRKLIQKNHPDRGGSDYLASKINLAKDILINK